MWNEVRLALCKNPVPISTSVNPSMVLVTSKISSMFTLRNGNYKLTLCSYRCMFGKCHTIFLENTGMYEKSILYSVRMPQLKFTVSL